MSCFSIQMTAKRVARLTRGHSRFESPIDEAIRTFMDTDNIEDLYGESPVLEMWEQNTGFDGYFEEMLGDLRSLRVTLKERSRETTLGLNATLIASAIDEAKYGYSYLVSEVQKQHQMDEDRIFIEQGRALQALKTHLNPIAYRFKKAKLSLSSYYPKRLQAAANKRDKRLAKLDEAMDVMEKHRALITLAQDEIIWDPEVFARDGRVQGRLGTNGIRNCHVERVNPGEYNIHLRWMAYEAPRYRPVSIVVERRRNYYNTPKIEWTTCEPPKRGPEQQEFPIVINVKDEFLFNEWKLQVERRRILGPQGPVFYQPFPGHDGHLW